MEVKEVLKEAKKYMKIHKAADWSTYSHFKSIANDNGNKWLSNKDYGYFIDNITKILKL